MAKNTSVLLGDHFETFIQEQVRSGRYASASEVVRTALRQFEIEELKRTRLNQELEIGENSGFVGQSDAVDFLSRLHKKHPLHDL